MYFIPNGKASNPAKLVIEQGLGYAFDGVSSLEYGEIVNNGPGGGPGALLFDGKIERGSKVELAKQTWQQMPLPLAGDRVIWFGFYTDKPPAIEAFARADRLDGECVMLEGGQQLIAPRARMYAEDYSLQQMRPTYIDNLPRMVRIEPDGGEVFGDVKSRFKRLWSLVEQYESAIGQLSDVEQEQRYQRLRQLWTMLDELNLVDQALKANYRIGAGELSALGLWDSTAKDLIVRALLDINGLERIQKKILATLVSAGSQSGPQESQPVEVPTEQQPQT